MLKLATSESGLFSGTYSENLTGFRGADRPAKIFHQSLTDPAIQTTILVLMPLSGPHSLLFDFFQKVSQYPEGSEVIQLKVEIAEMVYQQVIQCLAELKEMGRMITFEQLQADLAATSPHSQYLFTGVKLTTQEVKVLKLICQQKTTAEIAEKLFISSNTVMRHKQNIREKIDAKNLVGYVTYALKNRIISVADL